MKSLLCTLSLIILSVVCHAQLRFTNHTSEPVTVAVGIAEATQAFKGWYSLGWYACSPNETIVISKSAGSSDYVYYYAQSTSRAYEGDTPMLVIDDRSFVIKNANMQYAQAENGGSHWVKFRREKMSTLRLGYTIHLNY